MHYITYNSYKPSREVEHQRSLRANSMSKKKHIPPSSEGMGGGLSENSPCFTIVLDAEVLGLFPLLSAKEGVFLDTR